MLNQKKTLTLSILISVLALSACQPKNDAQKKESDTDQGSASEVIDQTLTLQGQTEKIALKMPDCDGNSCPEFSIDRLQTNQFVVDSIIDQAILKNLDQILDITNQSESIKSEKDNLKRWITQMDAYLNVFDEVWLCVHGKHLESALTITPKTIGIIVVDNYESLALVRSAKKQSSNNAYDLSGLLWRDELNDLASQHKIQIRSRTTKNEVREILAKNLDIEIIREFVLKQLKIRKSHQTSSVSPIVS